MRLVSQSVTSCEDTPHDSGTDFETYRRARRLQVLTIDSTLDTLYPGRTGPNRPEENPHFNLCVGVERNLPRNRITDRNQTPTRDVTFDSFGTEDSNR